MSSHPADSIAEAAARWVVVLDEDRSAATRAAFERWLRADAFHEAAYERLKATRTALGGLTAIKNAPALARLRAEALNPPPRQAQRSKVVLLGFGLLAAAAAAVTILVLPPASSHRTSPTEAASDIVTETHVTSVARLIALPDGSMVELNAGSQLAVAFSREARQVTLKAGEAHFSVVKDAARPFIVTVGDLAVRAVGTAFNVRLAPSRVEVIVTEGRVDVAPQTASTAPTNAVAALVPTLEAGQRVVVATTGSTVEMRPTVEAVGPAAIERALAWQTSLLVFDETPLSEAVEQFNRRNRVQIVLADRELASQRVGGKIRVDSPEKFVRVLETGGALAADYDNPEQIVLRKVRR